MFGHRHRLETVTMICGYADFTSFPDSPKNRTGEKERQDECVQVRPAALLFPPSLPQMTSFTTEKLQLILNHNMREGEKAQLIPLGTWRWRVAGGRVERAQREGRECGGWPGWSRDSEAPVPLLAMEHAHLIPINFCHYLQISFSVTASDKTIVTGDQAGNTSHCLCGGTRWAPPARAAAASVPKLWPLFLVLPFLVCLGTGADLWGSLSLGFRDSANILN